VRATPVNCDGKIIDALTVPHGEGMPLAAVDHQRTTPVLKAMESPRLHWIIPRCGKPIPGLGFGVGVRQHGSADPEEIPATGQVNSANWSGFQSTGDSYTSVQAGWNVPAIVATCGSSCDSYSSAWVGLGPPCCAATSDLLIQDGTESDNVNGANSYVAWYEMYPYQPDIVPFPNITVNRGDSVDVVISNGGSDTALFSMADTSNGDAYGFSQAYPSSYTLATNALWIMERPLVNNNQDYARLADFNVIDWVGAYATDSQGTEAPVGNWKRDFDYMYSCGNTELLAETGDISGDDDFPVDWEGFPTGGLEAAPC